jgi:hypothetical protein
MKSFIRFFPQQILVVVFSWSSILQQSVYISVLLYHYISTVYFCILFYKTLMPISAASYFLQHTLMSCLSLSLPDAQFPSFSILFLLCTFKHCSLMLERAYDIEAFFVSWIMDMHSSESSIYHQYHPCCLVLSSQVLIVIDVHQCRILKVECISVCTLSPP